MGIKQCMKCEWRRGRMNKTPGKTIPGGTGKCIRPEGPCEAYIPAGNIGEIAEKGERPAVITPKA